MTAIVRAKVEHRMQDANKKHKHRGREDDEAPAAQQEDVTPVDVAPAAEEAAPSAEQQPPASEPAPAKVLYR